MDLRERASTNGSRHPWETVRSAFFNRKIVGLTSNQPVHVLDIGSGDCWFAEKLIPKNHGFGTRRVPLETRYYEAYNRDNVKLVDINQTPIEGITPKGIKTSDAEYEFDMIIYATGFDAITGAFDRIDIRGIGGQRLKDKWQVWVLRASQK
jgi:hypothetical protein